jgi:hypothetical protein
VAKPPLAVAPLPYALALSPFALLLTPTAVALAPVVIAPGPIETALVLGGLAVPPPAVYWAAAGLATAATPAAITRPLSAPPASALVESSARWECGRSVAGEAARLAETKLPENRFCSVAINESPPLPESESATTMSQKKRRSKWRISATKGGDERFGTGDAEMSHAADVDALIAHRKYTLEGVHQRGTVPSNVTARAGS